MDVFYQPVDPEILKKERNKARELRDSAWWRNQLGRGRCHYCEAATPPSELTMDHKTPLARGGKSTRQNLVPCCKPCNSEKQSLTLGEWIAQREAQGRPLACARHELS